MTLIGTRTTRLFDHFEESGGCWAALKKWDWDAAAPELPSDEGGFYIQPLGMCGTSAYHNTCGTWSYNKNPLGLCPKHYKEITGRDPKPDEHPTERNPRANGN